MRLVGIDVGGTFTDFILWDGRKVRTHKVPSTPRDPAKAVEQGLRDLLPAGSASIVHGCTLATNAFLQRRGARVVLFTTKGFEDLLEIGRQNRARLYDLDWSPDEPLVPRARRIGVDERIGPDGRVLRPLRRSATSARGAQAAAICFLHSYANPRHERLAARGLRIPVTLSSDLVPEYREYERLATTVLNAYVMPVMDRYLRELGRRTRGRELRIMVSNGGQTTPAIAAREPVRTLLSGPAGGAVAVSHLCRRLGIPRAIAFDMGGTSTDVSVFDGGIDLTRDGTLGGFPIRVPILDLHTVGAGGGSIARFDAGGVLRVGPESAGADPGPASYGKGGKLPTVTDAHVALGRIHPRHFFGGRMRLDVDAARRAVGRISKDTERAARAILDVTGANLERAVRAVSVERGRDPARFVLVPFGGAGPLHACDLAERLGMKRVLVPRTPGLLSALGMTLADEVEERSASALRDIDDRVAIERAFRSIGLEGKRFADLRYEGQSYEIRTPWGPGAASEFARRHVARYGYSRSARIEVVTVTIRRTRSRPKPAMERLARGSRSWTGGTALRSELKAGDRLSGPLVVMEDNASTYVKRGWKGQVDPWGNLNLSPERKRRRTTDDR
jgi:N-methylhydantoinase A